MSYSSRPVSPHNSRSSRKSSHVRGRHSRSPPKKRNRSRSRSFSPVKDSRKKQSIGSDCESGNYKKKKSIRSPLRQYKTKSKLSETSLFAELVKDRQMRELAMKRLTQINSKKIDENEVVEIHDSDDEQSVQIIEANQPTKSPKADVDSCKVSKLAENTPKISKPQSGTTSTSNINKGCVNSNTSTQLKENLNSSVSKVQMIENGTETKVENVLLNKPNTIPSDITKPNEVVETKDLTKLPLPPIIPMQSEILPQTEIKSLKKSIRDLPLPPGKFFFFYKFTVYDNILLFFLEFLFVLDIRNHFFSFL